MKGKIGLEIISFLFILLFLYAAGVKLSDIETFRVQLAQSPLLTAYAGKIAWFIPVLEILIAVLLMTLRLRLLGLYASFGLMVMFTLYIMAILTFSEELPCACGGVLSMLHWKGHLVFNLVFVVLSVVGIHLTKESANSIVAT